MSLKKILCLLLALMMVFTTVSCRNGKDRNESSGDKTPESSEPATEPSATKPPATKPPATEPPASDSPATDLLDTWIVTEEVNHRGNIYRYQYDEHGELTSYALYDEDGTKLRDYKATHSVTEAGGKLITVESKHVKDSAFAKDNEMEYDTAGNLIRKTYFVSKKLTHTYNYTYDQDGNLLTYEWTGSSTVPGAEVRKASYTYTDGVLATASGRIYIGNNVYHYDFSYSHDKYGSLNEINYNVSGAGEGTITLEKDFYSRSEGGLRVLTSSTSAAPGYLYFFEAELEENGRRTQFTINFKRWGGLQWFSLPLPGYGSIMVSWDECEGSITYTRLGTYLEQNA